jgi:hypothetical protein
MCRITYTSWWQVQLSTILQCKLKFIDPHKTVNISSFGDMYNHSLHKCNGIQYVCSKFNNLCTHTLLGMEVVERCISVARQFSFGMYVRIDKVSGHTQLNSLGETSLEFLVIHFTVHMSHSIHENEILL